MVSVAETRETKYVCEVCRTPYSSYKEALECDTLPVEAKHFELGDVVRWREPRLCRRSHQYFAEGPITKIELKPPDVEYIREWLNGDVWEDAPDNPEEYVERLRQEKGLYKKHKWEITFEFRCPHCGDKLDMQVYQEELIKLS